MSTPSDRRSELESAVAYLSTRLGEAHQAREKALPLCRQVVRLSGRSIRAVHRLEPDRAETLVDEAESTLRTAQEVLDPFPNVYFAGFLSDAEKEYVEARLTPVLIGGSPLLSAQDLSVAPSSWLKGMAEAASELRRHLLDRLREDDLETAERLLVVMDDVYDVLMTVEYPDALTGGLRRTVDALRAVLERSRGDVTTTVVQNRLRFSIEDR